MPEILLVARFTRFSEIKAFFRGGNLMNIAVFSFEALLLYKNFSLRNSKLVVFLLLCMSLQPRLLLAGGEVSAVITHDEVNSPFQYSVNGQTYTWGVGVDQVLDGFVVDGKEFKFLTRADRAEVKRVDRPGLATGAPCSVFAEHEADFTRLHPSYPGDGSAEGNCDLSRMLTGRVINRGALNVFSNVGPDRKNIERVDFKFKHGSLAPLQSELLALSGHLVSEKRGNNPIQVAAILSLDAAGEPASYGPLVTVGCRR